MQKILQWLQQPYPLEKRWPQVLRIALWAGAFVMLFLFLLKPFGTQIDEGYEWIYLRYCALFGLVTAVVTILVYGFCLFLPSIFDEEKWRVWKEILFNIFFIGCIGFVSLADTRVNWRVFRNPATLRRLDWMRLHSGTMMGAFTASTTAFTVQAAHFLPWFLQWFGPALLMLPFQIYFGRKLKGMRDKALKVSAVM